VDWFLYFAIFVICYIIGLVCRRYKKRTKQVYDPFASYIMFSRCECQVCETLFDKAFEQFEYAYQKIKYPCPTCGKDTDCIILGSFYLNIKSRNELKLEREYEKWYTDYQREERWRKYS